MSWDAYITNNLMVPLDQDGTTLQSAAILGLDGSTWAKSETFPQVSTEEFNKMIAAMNDVSITSVLVGGQKFMKLQSDETVLRCRQGKEGFIARKTASAFIVGFYVDPPISAPVCAKLIDALCDYLEEQGY